MYHDPQRMPNAGLGEPDQQASKLNPIFAAALARGEHQGHRRTAFIFKPIQSSSPVSIVPPKSRRALTASSRQTKRVLVPLGQRTDRLQTLA